LGNRSSWSFRHDVRHPGIEGRGRRTRRDQTRAAKTARPAAAPYLWVAGESLPSEKEHSMTQNSTCYQAVSRDQLDSFCVGAMVRCGMTEADARLGADVLVTTDLWGVHSHGVKALRTYLKRMRAGGLKARGVPRVVAEGPAWAVMDGDNALAMVSSCRGMEAAIAKAGATGIGNVSVRNSCHFGAAGYYAKLAAKADMIGLAMSNADVNMTVPGGKGKIIGNNPMAYAIPAGEEPPLMLDMALSTVAAGRWMPPPRRASRSPTTGSRTRTASPRPIRRSTHCTPS